MMSMSPQILASEDLGHGVTREWLADGRIMVLRMPEGAHRDAIDVWFNTLMGVLNHWDRARPFLVLHDNRQMGFSYYFRERALEVSNSTPEDLRGRVAVVLPNGPIGYLVTMLAKLTRSQSAATFELKATNNFDKALEWLRQGFEP